MSSTTTTLPTVGEIARRLGESLHRIEYVIRSRNIQPTGRAGHFRIFAESDVVHIADELRLIDARQQNEAPADASEGDGAAL